MPTVGQAAEWYAAEVRKGNADLHTTHPVIIERENEKRKRNAPDEKGKRKTKIVWEAGDPDVFGLFHAERTRYMEAAGGNPVLATEAMIMALKVQSTEIVRNFIEALQSAEKPSLGDA